MSKPPKAPRTNNNILRDFVVNGEHFPPFCSHCGGEGLGIYQMDPEDLRERRLIRVEYLHRQDCPEASAEGTVAPHGD